jgi:hypothetical protein
MVYNKYKSRRYLITLWAITLITFLMVYSIITRYTTDWLSISLPLLLAIPSVYIAGESLSKKYTKEQ